MHFDRLEATATAKGTVLLSSGLGGAAAYWAPQLVALREHFHVVTYDHAGTGRNRRALPDGYGIADMADEVLEILDEAGTQACHFVGHALGGLVGLQLAMQAPTRLESLTVVNGWATADSHTKRCFEARLALLQHVGVAAYVRAQPIFLYPATWLATNAARMENEDRHGIAGFQGEDTLRKRVAALLQFDMTASLGSVRVPTLAIAAKDDVLVPATQSERLAAAIPAAHLFMADWGGHAINVTDPAAFNLALLDFLARRG
jgi:aminoacrylate hydrolase